MVRLSILALIVLLLPAGSQISLAQAKPRQGGSAPATGGNELLSKTVPQNDTAATSPGSVSLAERATQVAKELADQQEFVLKYQFRRGEEIRWNVEHIASTKTQISGKHEATSSRTQSVKLWRVSDVDQQGNASFVYSVESSSLWQQIGDDDPVSYDSKSAETIPDQFLAASEMIGKPLAVVRISPSGKVLHRSSSMADSSFGVDICTPLPEKPVAVGYQWHVPVEFPAVDEDGRRLTLKARISYQLSRVNEGIAVISFRTEVLTPIEDQQIYAQLLQKLNDGYLAFDIAKGRAVTKEIEWNEKVESFAGEDSHLQYIGRLTEKLLDSQSVSATASRPMDENPPGTNPNTQIKRPDSPPIIRK